MSTVGTIIFLLVIAWQVISQIVAQSKKKELEEQRSAGTAQRARRVQGQGPASSGPGRSDSAEQASLAPPTLRSGGASAQDLAARRRAQLEELRSRRQNRGVSGPSQARPATPPPRTTGPRNIEALDLDFADRQRADAEQKRLQDRAEEQLRKQQELERARRQREAVQAHRHQEAPLQPVAPTRPMRAEPHHAIEHSEVHRLVEDAGGAPVAESTLRDQAQARNLARIRGRLQTKRDLRDLFILRELIDPPVSLRKPPEIG